MATKTATSTKSTAAQSTLKEQVKSAATEGVEKLEKVAQESKAQTLEAVSDAEEKISTEVQELNQSVQTQLLSFKQDLLNRLEQIKGQVSLNPKDFLELKDFIKAEFSTVFEDLTKLGKELKEDVSQISIKHKDQLTDTFKRSKEHTLEAWHKVSTKQ